MDSLYDRHVSIILFVSVPRHETGNVNNTNLLRWFSTVHG